MSRLLADAEPPVYVTPRSDVESLPPAGYVEPGRIGDPDSWRTEEFELDYAKGLINAHYAYARGLTGAGVRLGIIDTGVAFEHTEFAGKNNAGLIWTEFREDGSRCGPRADGAIILSEGGCFYTDGGKVETEYFRQSEHDTQMPPLNAY